ncbi:hypothetical protein [Chroococcus sp. FPU101]|uniref:hypothetical protein n=1 Tax=Chroococcus sp. FPU101 TaxID=1974212 RepID=UPI001A908080|nr:hypothetical protein [Chroococcus sp. FPU101]GFE68807.1 hypothetical protein CFPU101_14170 [Chroococcus sp. FPU101]
MNQLTPFVNKLRRAKRNFEYSVQDLTRSFNQSSKIVNQKEIRVIGLKRSGNHAIINWIWKQYGEDVTHLNNLRVKCNPYRFLYEHYPTERLKREALGNFTEKELLIYSYEDHRLEDIVHQSFEKKHDLYLGKSAKRYDLLILRDPFNCFASRIKMYINKNQYDKHHTLVTNESVKLWLSYAQEFLGETNFLKNNKICINYNLWCSEIDYRQQLAKQLDLEFSDAEFERVKEQGGGSSFDGLSLKEQGSKMKVTERWKLMAEHPFFIELINNSEVLEYSNQIFGEISGTEFLLKKNN